MALSGESVPEVVRQHARGIYRAARAMGFSASDADDLTQEVFVTFLETLDKFEGRSAVSTWLFGILHYKVLERRRAHLREESSDSVEHLFDSRFDQDGSWSTPPVPADRLVASAETANALRDCLATLPEQHREVFHLRQVEELSAAEVGKRLQATPNHVGVLFHRARVRLRACLEAKGWGRSL